MRNYATILGSLLLVLSAVGCGDDDDTGAACPEGVTPGGSVSCACGDGGARGVQLCKPSKKLSECDCSDALGGDAGGGKGGSSGGAGSTSTGGGSGGKGSSGSGGSTSSGGSGGSTTPQSDAGKPPVQGMDAGSGNTTPPPMDGDQLSICMSGVDCNRGLDCYNTPAPGDGFCSKVCMADADCMGITGGTYVCSQSTGICVIDCMGTDDTSCPMGMACEETFGGFGGTGGQNGGGTGGAGAVPATFRCGYPAGVGMPRAAAWAACMSPISADCEMGLTCNGSGAAASGSGYCTQTCMNDDGCSMKPSSGDIAPTCEPMRMGGGGPGQGGQGQGGQGQGERTCVLDCAMKQDGCPDGMSCVTNMFLRTSRCEFQ